MNWLLSIIKWKVIMESIIEIHWNISELSIYQKWTNQSNRVKHFHLEFQLYLLL